MSVWIPLIAAVMAQTAPSAEAEALGVRLAESGTLAALLPGVVAKERDEEISKHADWSEADRAAYRQVADDTARAAIARLTAAIGHGYAAKMSVEDLRAAVAFNETPAGRRWREATPGAVMEAMAAIGAIDLGGDTRKAFCAKTGKLCEK